MACRAPVVASRIPALVEVLGDAAELVAPQDVEAWSASLTVLFADSARREALATRGIARARTFSWSETARQTVEVYRVLGVGV
jgi:alpha-1,3-rhamnosyl/mannosyltransferase